MRIPELFSGGINTDKMSVDVLLPESDRIKSRKEVEEQNAKEDDKPPRKLHDFTPKK